MIRARPYEAAATPDTLAVSETFLSIQGEGPSSGERAVFLRLAGCNLNCTWCDTPYAWDWTRHDPVTQMRRLSPAQTAAETADLAGNGTRLLVLTGGEPLLQQYAVVRLLDILRVSCPALRCEVETNGSVLPNAGLASLVNRFVVSPKLEHSGITERARLRPRVLRAFAAEPKAVLKIVAATSDDVREAAVLAETAGFAPHRVWIMPLAADARTCLETARVLVDHVIAAGFNLTNRTQLLLWGNTRGR